MKPQGRLKIKKVTAYRINNNLFRYKKDALEFLYANAEIKVGDLVKLRIPDLNPRSLGFGTVIEIMSIEEYHKRLKKHEVNWLVDVYGVIGRPGRIIKVKEYLTESDMCYPEFDLYRIKK